MFHSIRDSEGRRNTRASTHSQHVLKEAVPHENVQGKSRRICTSVTTFFAEGGEVDIDPAKLEALLMPKPITQTPRTCNIIPRTLPLRTQHTSQPIQTLRQSLSRQCTTAKNLPCPLPKRCQCQTFTYFRRRHCSLYILFIRPDQYRRFCHLFVLCYSMQFFSGERGPFTIVGVEDEDYGIGGGQVGGPGCTERGLAVNVP